jgi:uncharacterized membrane protein YeaQ/YmgE (transglycosylase-associated protein family)
MELIVQLIAGAIGGNAAGAVLKNQSMGPLINSVLGILGGGLGGKILAMLGAGAMASGGGSMDIGSIVASLASGGVGGGALMAIVGLIKNMMAKS